MKEIRSSRRQHNVPTITDVAAHAGVSPMTVSRVVNGKGSVRPATRASVESAIAALGYAPNAAARALAGGEEIRICLLHTNPSLTYFSDFLVGGLDQASRSNVQLVIEKCEEDGHEAATIERLLQGRIDGIALPPPLSDSPVVLAALEGHGIPVVAVATGRAPDWALSVSIDDRRAAYDMTRHLGALGTRGSASLPATRNKPPVASGWPGIARPLPIWGWRFCPNVSVPGCLPIVPGWRRRNGCLACTSRQPPSLPRTTIWPRPPWQSPTAKGSTYRAT